jgi:hypothetical protein
MCPLCEPEENVDSFGQVGNVAHTLSPQHVLRCTASMMPPISAFSYW